MHKCNDSFVIPTVSYSEEEDTTFDIKADIAGIWESLFFRFGAKNQYSLCMWTFSVFYDIIIRMNIV